MFTDKQLETIYRAVKTEYQNNLAKTLTNWGTTVRIQESARKRMKDCEEIMRIINVETGNLVEEI